MAKANADAATIAQTNGSVPISSQAQEARSSPQVPNQGLKMPVEIRIDDATEVDGEGEEEVEHDDYAREDEEQEVEYEEEYEEEGEEDLEVSSTFGEYGGERRSYSPSSFSHPATPEAVPEGEDDPENDSPVGHRRSRTDSDYQHSSSPAQRPRKRSCDELEEEDAPDGSTSRGLGRKKEGTPPKRARKGDNTRNPGPVAVLDVGERRKRGSEELVDDEDDDCLDDIATRGERTRRTSVVVRARRSSSSSERSGDTTSPHKRLKVGDKVDDYRDGAKRSRGSRVSASLSVPLSPRSRTTEDGRS